MNVEDIKHKLNLVAAIAAVGAIIAFAGVLSAYSQFPEYVNILDLIIFGLIVFISLVNIRPALYSKTLILNIVIGILAIAITVIDYIRIGDATDAQSFMDVGIGVWLMFTGSILYTIFTASDIMFKKKA